MRNFESRIISTLALVGTGVLAQLPRECFFLTQLRGPAGFNRKESELLTDLPLLMEKYQPGMRLHAISSYQNAQDRDLMTGLQAELVSPSASILKLDVIGVQLDFWHSEKTFFS